MQPVLVPLRAVVEPRESGGKAFGLSLLLKAGLPVPDGYVVETHWYRCHLEACGAAEVVASLRTASREAAGHAALLATVRSRIEKAPLAPEVRSSLQSLDDRPWCFRSSATDEDGSRRSMAGLHDSVLGCCGAEACEAALKRCWASFWSVRAWTHRRSAGAGEDAAMAVVIQPLVEAEVSGVVFTADPLGGGEDEILLEVVYGLGEGLVSGQVTPDSWCLGRPRLEVRKCVVNDKSVCVGLDGDATGPSLRPVPQPMATRPAISVRVAREVARAALRAEAVVGRAVDVEWVRARGRTWLLQARPITTLGEGRGGARPVWTRANVGEVVPDVATPMTWEMVQRIIHALFNDNLRRVGLDFGPQAPVGRVGGRVYFDLARVSAMIHSLPFGRHLDLTLALGGHQDLLPAEERRRMQQRRIPPRIQPWRLLVGLPLGMAWFLSHTPGRQQAYVARIRRETDQRLRALQAAPPRDASEAWQRAQALMDRLEEMCREFIAAGTGAAWHFALHVLCRRWLGDQDGSVAHRLLAGDGRLESAEAGYDIKRLAVEASARAEVAAAVAEGGAWSEVRRRLEASAEGRTFLECWDAFMFSHGHHARGEVELCNARWSEQPEKVLGWVRAWLQGPREDPAEAVQAARDALLVECRARLSNPLKRWALETCRRQAASGIALRETLKSQGVRSVATLRGLLLALGEALVEQGLLVRRDDVFFCHVAELEQLAAPGTSASAAEMIQRGVEVRRAEYEACLALDPPDLVVGDLAEGLALEDPSPGTQGELRGTAVSPGVVEGRARVITAGAGRSPGVVEGRESVPAAGGEEEVRPGEILVLPHADPGWAPVFLHASGIVLDMGGMLSHGCIIAREYGIPTVANVRTGTRVFRTGMLLRVDGNRGVVQVLEDPPADVPPS